MKIRYYGYEKQIPTCKQLKTQVPFTIKVTSSKKQRLSIDCVTFIVICERLCRVGWVRKHNLDEKHSGTYNQDGDAGRCDL